MPDGSMGIWYSRQTFSTIFLKAKCATSSETLDDEWQSDFWMLTA
jgi:hypothetical protein